MKKERKIENMLAHVARLSFRGPVLLFWIENKDSFLVDIMKKYKSKNENIQVVNGITSFKALENNIRAFANKGGEYVAIDTMSTLGEPTVAKKMTALAEEFGLKSVVEAYG